MTVAAVLASTAASARPAPTPGDARMRATAQAFEAVLLGQLTGLMLGSAPTDGEFSGGHGEDMFRGVLAEQIGNEIARRGGLGLAPAILQQIITLQQGANQ